jgi:hypothetical protein
VAFIAREPIPNTASICPPPFPAAIHHCILLKAIAGNATGSPVIASGFAPKARVGTVQMLPSQQALLDRILASPHFAHTMTLGKILRYVCEKTAGTQGRLKEYEIATEVLERHQSFDPKVDPVVRVSMKGIRQKLQRYFDDEGKRESHQLLIPKGQYSAQFVENDSLPGPELEDVAQALKFFWSSYLGQSRPNLIAYTEPLFFREGWQTYVRNLYVNDPGSGNRHLIERLPELGARELHPSFHYLDSGEVHSMFLLMQFFHQLGAPVGVRNARIASWHEMRNSNLVLVGCARTNPFMDMLQEETDFIIAEDEIRNLALRDGELSSYRGERYHDSKLPRYREYVLITRRPGSWPNSTVTMIAANHGRAIEGATSHLTAGPEILKLLSAINVNQGSALPKRFQILLRVEMIDLDDEIVDVEYVSHRMSAD